MIKDLAELEKFLKLCRKQGVKEIKFGDIAVVLGDAPRKSSSKDDGSEPTSEGMTPEEMIFFSAGGAAPP